MSIMKILYLINTKEHDYHRLLITDFSGVIPGDVIDMADGCNLGKRYHEIEAADPDVVITFDAAGFELRTGNDTLSMNNISARMAHILFHKSEKYADELKYRQNLSMFTFIPKDEDLKECIKSFPAVPNILKLTEISTRPESVEEHDQNRTNIRTWWELFKKEAML